MQKQKITKTNFKKVYESGLPLERMAIKYGVSRITIMKYASKLGLSRGKGFKRQEDVPFDF